MYCTEHLECGLVFSGCLYGSKCTTGTRRFSSDCFMSIPFICLENSKCNQGISKGSETISKAGHEHILSHSPIIHEKLMIFYYTVLTV